MDTNKIKTVLSLIKGKGFIAGGICKNIINGEKFKDIDIFCYNKNSFEDLKMILKNNLSGEQRENDLVFEIGNVQLVKPQKTEYMCSYGTEYEVVSTFDFTICRGYLDENLSINWIDGEDNNKHLKRKQLHIKHIVCPISSLKRALKYASYGYYLPMQQMLKLLKEIQNRKIDLDILSEIPIEGFYEYISKFD